MEYCIGSILISCLIVSIAIDTLHSLPQPISPRLPIVDGKIVSSSETKRFPFAVSFGFLVNGSYSHFCGGCIIASDSASFSWAITAAHCFEDEMSNTQNETIYAKIGDSDLSTVSKVFRIEEILKANFCPYSLQNDVALVRIACECQQQVMKLAINMPSPNSKCLIYGFGSTSYQTNTIPSNKLLYGYVEAISYRKCEQIIGRAVAPVEGSGEFCAQGIAPDYADACGGDSGSALICSSGGNSEEYKLVGIVSYGMGCGTVHSAGVYQSVIYHRQWIEETLENEFKKIKEEQLN